MRTYKVVVSSAAETEVVGTDDMPMAALSVSSQASDEVVETDSTMIVAVEVETSRFVNVWLAV